jgi:hypothetical protein
MHRQTLLPIIITGKVLLGTTLCLGQTREVPNSYGIKISVPNNWSLDTSELINAKVKLTELLSALKTEGKVRILNTGTAPGALEGYCRVRLNITTDITLSQAEAASLTDEDLKEMEGFFGKELQDMPLFHVDKDSISVKTTRSDDGYSGFRLSYVRSGTKGPVNVYQYWFPFSNRCAQLTLSYEVANQEALWPSLLKILASLRLDDKELWPKNPS